MHDLWAEFDLSQKARASLGEMYSTDRMWAISEGKSHLEAPALEDPYQSRLSREHVCTCVQVCSRAQAGPTLCNPIDCSPPGSSVCGIFQVRIWSWLPFPLPGDLPWIESFYFPESRISSPTPIPPSHSECQLFCGQELEQILSS